MVKKVEESYFKKDGHLNSLGISLCADAVLDMMEETLPEEVKVHITLCDECKVDIEELIEVVKTGDIMSWEFPVFRAPKLNNKNNSKRFNKSLFWAAAIFLFLLIITKNSWQSIFFFNNKNFINYELNQEMEDLVRDVYRSKSVIIKKPKLNEVVDNPVELRWTNTKGKPSTIVLLDSNGRIVFTELTSDTVLVIKKILEPAQYYWKIENEEELLAIGKFKVAKP